MKSLKNMGGGGQKLKKNFNHLRLSNPSNGYIHILLQWRKTLQIIGGGRGTQKLLLLIGGF